jgi:uncharacterized RDD family membrane protein YckC
MTEPPPPQGNYPPQQGGYPPPPQGNYPPPPQGGYPPPPQGGYSPPPQGNYRPAPGGYPPISQQSGYQQGGFPPPPAQVRVLPKEAYTPWIHRVGAAIIDLLPVLVVIGIGQGIAFGTADNQCVSGAGDYDISCTSSFSALGAIVNLLTSVLAFAYWVWNYGYRQGTTGSSIGKSVLKFQVVSEKTWLPIGFGLSIVRQIAHFVDQIICYIGYLFPLWDAKRQTLADKIMTTVCVPLQPTTQTAN